MVESRSRENARQPQEYHQGHQVYRPCSPKLYVTNFITETVGDHGATQRQVLLLAVLSLETARNRTMEQKDGLSHMTWLCLGILTAYGTGACFHMAPLWAAVGIAFGDRQRTLGEET